MFVDRICLNYGVHPLFSLSHMKNGQTALMWAAGSGQLEIVSKLIGSGAKLDTTNTVSIDIVMTNMHSL